MPKLINVWQLLIYFLPFPLSLFCAVQFDVHFPSAPFSLRGYHVRVSDAVASQQQQHPPQAQ